MLLNEPKNKQEWFVGFADCALVLAQGLLKCQKTINIPVPQFADRDLGKSTSINRRKRPSCR